MIVNAGPPGRPLGSVHAAALRAVGVRALPRSLLHLGLAVVFLLTLGLAGDAEAKKKKRPSKAGNAPLSVVVLPFEGEGALRHDLPMALELELELLESVVVKSNKRTWVSLRKKGTDRFSAKTLKATMKGRKVDVIIRGESGWSEEGDPVIHVIGYASDGRARVHRSFPTPDDIDATAVLIAEALAPALEKWRDLKPFDVKLPPPPPAGESVAAGDTTTSSRPPPDEAGVDEGVRQDPANGADEERLFVEGRSTTDDGEADRSPPQRARLDAVDSRAAARARARRHTLVGGDGGVDGEEPEVPLTHMFSFAVGGGIGLWYYQFTGTTQGHDAGFGLTPGPFPGFSVRADAWPIPWVGIDADVRLSVVPFEINSPGAAEPLITPANFLATQVSTGVSARARYVLELGAFGIGAGARAGYRFLGGFVDKQTHRSDGGTYTIVPSYRLHAGTVGAEAIVAARFFERRFAFEVKADAIPGISVYEEYPDNPAPSTRAFGWNAVALLRGEAFYGIFGELALASSGAVVEYSGDQLFPNQRTFLDETGQRIPLGPGTVMNVDFALNVALGFQF